MRRFGKQSFWSESDHIIKVKPTDIDLAGHVNNGRYLAFFDMSRWKHFIVSGVIDEFRKKKWYYVIQAQTIRYKKSAKMGKISVKTLPLGYGEKELYFLNRVYVNDEIMTEAYVAARVLGKKGPVDLESVKEVLGQPETDLTPQWVRDWMKATISN